MNEQRFDSTSIPANWRPAVRVDVGRLARATKTAVGYRIDGAVGRSGILEYTRADGTKVREYLPPEEAGRLDSLMTLRDAPVTVSHPAGGTRMVSPSTYREDSVGHVSGEPSFDRVSGRIGAALAVQELSAIARIDRGELTELSLGYNLMIDPTPGTTPSGERYDAIQRNRVYNHVALLPPGHARAGTEASLRLDGVDANADLAFARFDEDDLRTERAPVPARQSGMESRADMKIERIDGRDLEVGSAEWAAARERVAVAPEKTRADAAESQVKDLTAKLTTETARADSAEGKVKALEAQLTPAAIDKLVSERTALITKAQSVLGPDAKFDGKSDHEIRLAVVQKLDATFKVDSIEESQRLLYVQARFDADTRNAPTTAGAPRSPLARTVAAVLAPTAPTRAADQRADDRAEPYVPLMQRMARGYGR